MRKLLLIILAFSITVTLTAQKNFTYTPEKPKPGDVITFTYESSGDLAKSLEPVEAILYSYGSKGRKADDLLLKRKGYTYTGTITTDTSQNFISLGFYVDKKYDNNFDEGYYIHFYESDNIRKGSYANLSQFYQFYSTGVGVTRNDEKALAMLEKEMTLYPDNKKANLQSYLRLLLTLKKPEAAATIQKEIEAALKKGLKEEADYTSLEMLYNLAKLPEQGKLITSLKKEKFPTGKWVLNDATQKFYAEQDLAKKKESLAVITRNVETDSNWSSLRQSLPNLKQSLLSSYISKKDWTGFKTAVTESGITDKDMLASLYNSAAWRIQETDKDLDLAEEFTSFATSHAKTEWNTPTATKPDGYTIKQWRRQKEGIYGMYADTYGMVMYKLGKHKKGFPYAKDAAITVLKGQDAEQNTTYALLAEKVLPAKIYKKELEQFVKDGKASGKIKEILKTAYTKSNKSENGFDEYIASLEKESYLKMIEELRKSMLSETAPSFALLDLDGKNVNIADLKGKVVVVDFWATWCGPCIASFPGMQKMVTKYKDDNNVKFIFVDTWEREANKEKNATDFIASNKYSFHVLMDNENKVVEQFKVDGIPTKFVIDKEGLIRFKSVGFGGSDDKLMSELTAMIDMASDPSKKAF